MRPPKLKLRTPKLLPNKLPLARCLIAFYVFIFLIFSSLLSLLVVPFPLTVPSAHKFQKQNNNSNVGSGGHQGGGSRDIEWLMFHPNPVNQSTISVCARLGGLAAIGGIESWFWALQEYVLSSCNFRLHAVNLEALHWLEPSLDRFYFARSAMARIVELGARLNIGPEEIIDECDIVLSSWVDPPLRPPPAHPSFKSLLIIHGSDAIERKGTWLYAQQLHAYDATVCVSAGCMDAYGPAFQKQINDNKDFVEIPLEYIPSSIDLTKYDPTIDITHARAAFNLPIGNSQKILGFLGRIAEDKNPQLFVNVVSKLPKNWIGAMAGPLYLPEEQILLNLTSRIALLGDIRDTGSFLAAVDALYVPSKKEGGPIVLLEAWSMRKPLFMRRTGLAVDHEDGVFIIPEDSSPQDIAQYIDEKLIDASSGKNYSLEVQNKIEYGFKTVKEQFSTDVLRRKYHRLMNGLLEQNIENSGSGQASIRRLPFQVHYPIGHPPSLEVVQLTRRGRTLWARCFNKQCVFYVKFTSYNTNSSSSKVTIVSRTFSGVSQQSGSRSGTNALADGVAIYFRSEKATEKIGSINVSTARQNISLNLSTNIFAVELVDGHAIQILDVLAA
ncbi:hypothetical protein Ndes2526B_g03051 [Nannochloris sp. 'desiccata']|nr:hypothetical protein KSW81_006706 [Chlorella desiccata (nom. nud.)]